MKLIDLVNKSLEVLDAVGVTELAFGLFSVFALFGLLVALASKTTNRILSFAFVLLLFSLWCGGMYIFAKLAM